MATLNSEHITAEVKIDNIDFTLLRDQKRALLELEDKLRDLDWNEQQISAVTGMICLCDSIQDYAVDELGLNKDDIYYLTPEDEEENEEE